MSKLKPDDIFETYGAFNDLTVGGTTPVGSRRTLTTTEALSGWLESVYTPDVLEGKSVYDGVVMATIAANSPTLQSTQGLIEYLTDPSAEPIHYVYKVYIPEVEPRCINFSDRNGPSGEFTNAQRVMTLPNAVIDPKVPASENLRAIEPGTYVQVVYNNQEKLKNPKIVAIGKKVIELKGRLNKKGSLKTQFGKSRGRSFGQGVYRTSANHPSSRNSGTTAEGCTEYLKRSTKSSTPRVLALGASFAFGAQTWAGSKNLDLDRISKGGMVLAGHKTSILAHLKTNVNAGCLLAADYDSVIIFGGANGMKAEQHRRMKQLLEYLRDEMKIENRYVVTLHGWYGWRAIDDPPWLGPGWPKWSPSKRVQMMQYTLDYNEWMRNAGKKSGLVTDYLEWSDIATSADKVKTDKIGRIIPGSQDWGRSDYIDSDGLHPSSNGHKVLAGMLRTKLSIPGLVT